MPPTVVTMANAFGLTAEGDRSKFTRSNAGPYSLPCVALPTDEAPALVELFGPPWRLMSVVVLGAILPRLTPGKGGGVKIGAGSGAGGRGMIGRPVPACGALSGVWPKTSMPASPLRFTLTSPATALLVVSAVLRSR